MEAEAQLPHWAAEGRRSLGEAGEWLAHDLLARAGYDILARNWRAPFGEVDLIARRDGELHFFEVKTRRADDRFTPADNVTPAKIRRYQRLAAYFLRQHGLYGQVSVRYHLVGIVTDGRQARLSVTPLVRPTP